MLVVWSLEHSVTIAALIDSFSSPLFASQIGTWNDSSWSATSERLLCAAESEEAATYQCQEKARKGSLDDKLIPTRPAQSTVGPTPNLHLVFDIHTMNVCRPSPLDGAVLAYHNSGMGLFEKDLCWNIGHSMNIMWE